MAGAALMDSAVDAQWTLNGHSTDTTMDTQWTLVKHMCFKSAHRVSIVVSVERPIECPLGDHCISETGVHTVAHSACVQLVLLSW